MKRVLIFSHRNPQQIITGYIPYWLEQLHPLFERIIFVSSAQLNEADQKCIRDYAHRILIRENSRNKFDAWTAALKSEGWATLEEYDSVSVMDDSCFGPLYDVSPVFHKMESEYADFWGFSNRPRIQTYLHFKKDTKSTPVESYFLTFSRDVIRHKAFQKFWDKWEGVKSKRSVIFTFERKLSSLIERAGYKSKVLTDVSDIDTRFKSLMNNRPVFFIEEKHPFITGRSFFISRDPNYLLHIVEQQTLYPVQLIKDHMLKTYGPNRSSLIFPKNLFFDKSAKPDADSFHTGHIAVHIHAYYPDVFEMLYKVLSESGKALDMYVTTDSETKKNEIRSSIKGYDGNIDLKEISIFQNKGRDIIPWLALSDKLNEYDLVGHFHTKKSAYKDQKWIGETWMGHIIETLVEPVHEIAEYAIKHEDVGIIIPDIPSPMRGKIYNNHEFNKDHINLLWQRLNCNRKLDARKDLSLMIFPYGNMFWYKPRALQPLFDLNLSESEFPDEPIPSDGTLAHALERLPVYIAWSQGYDFRITLDTESIMSSFQSVQKFQSDLYESTSWKAGRFIMWLPSKIRKAGIRLKRMFA